MALTKNQKYLIVGGIAAIGLYVAYKKGWIFKKADVTTTDTASGINGAQYLAYKESQSNAAGGYTTTCRCYGREGFTNVPASCATQANCCKATCAQAGLSDKPSASASARTR